MNQHLTALNSTFTKWLGVDYDLDAIYLTLAAAAIAQHDGDPLWVLVVAGSGAGKTESTVTPLAGCEGVHEVSTISSEGALLSGTVAKDRAEDATGGLLRQVGENGIVLIKDFTSILSLASSVRPQILGALRECYDGSWSRQVGGDGGQELKWVGRLTVIGAVTTSWDQHQAVVSAMGDRFVLLRLRVDELQVGTQAIANTGLEKMMRAELHKAAESVLEAATDPGVELNPAERDSLLQAANITTWARTGVIVAGGKVVDAHAREAPTRFAKQLFQVLRGSVAIGVERHQALRLALRVAEDSIPPLRLELLRYFAANGFDADHPRGSDVASISRVLDRVHNTVDVALKALHMLRMIALVPESSPWRYRLAPGVDVDALNPGRVFQEMYGEGGVSFGEGMETPTSSECVQLTSTETGSESLEDRWLLDAPEGLFSHCV
ncbi:ArsR family transcriptional regulator [Mycobacterium sp. 236(2023)]|uniref:ArsR family transcriptional regulator n=1 Tax=Mycobacterium sp. 236(2023) TaxID=3038163 RepID=UPI00241563F6|nr:ArsR family transcriptional regulator [Mycobacterium sp. 236(2023)]MDG4667009.1 ArsR family transcriptional regulator [Mycobacterium sp. 236(2023)]